MKVGDIVRFQDNLYEDENGTTYKILELNGDRAILQFICDLPIPPQSMAKLDELQVVPNAGNDANPQAN
jgi:hypothetical protein